MNHDIGDLGGNNPVMKTHHTYSLYDNKHTRCGRITEEPSKYIPHKNQSVSRRLSDDLSDSDRLNRSVWGGSLCAESSRNTIRHETKHPPRRDLSVSNICFRRRQHRPGNARRYPLLGGHRHDTTCNRGIV